MHVEFSLTDPSSSLSKSTFSWDESGLVNITLCVISRSPAHNLSCSFFGKVCSNSSTSNDSFLEFFRLQNFKKNDYLINIIGDELLLNFGAKFQ